MYMFLSFSGQYLPPSAGTPDRVTRCQGTSTYAVCGIDSIIAVADIQYGTKLTTTCGLGNTSAGCCDYDSADCMITYSGTYQQAMCSGRSGCTFGNAVSAADTSSCGFTNYPVTNHYLTMEYYCLLGNSLYASFTLYMSEIIWEEHACANRIASDQFVSREV